MQLDSFFCSPLPQHAAQLDPHNLLRYMTATAVVCELATRQASQWPTRTEAAVKSSLSTGLRRDGARLVAAGDRKRMRM